MSAEALAIAVNGVAYWLTGQSHEFDMEWTIHRHPCDDKPYLSEIWPRRKSTWQ